MLPITAAPGATLVDSEATVLFVPDKPVDSEPTPVDRDPNPVESEPKPRRQELTLLFGARELVESDVIELRSVLIPVDSDVTPVESEPTPVEREVTLVDSELTWLFVPTDPSTSTKRRSSHPTHPSTGTSPCLFVPDRPVDSDVMSYDPC